LIGSLTLTETPGRLPDLRGKVTLRDGVFEAYGQKLKVERGELTFIGPVDDPVISLTASKVVERPSGDVTVSIVLTGTAKAIETEIRADPAMPEGDALALLLTGRTLSEMTSGEQTNVYGAAIALGLYGASGVTRSLAATMGLEEIIVGQDEQGAWEVGAAVRLQQNLYLRYTYGVFSRLGGVLLRYRLTDRVSVQAKAGDTQSIEIRYGVD
jgi:translocation and assembly module TamB